jgi:hypothetical protein
MSTGIVYVFSNPAMPSIVKIGLTEKDNIEDRLKSLFTTSVPFPFECEYACKVADCQKVEAALHVAFDPDRINPQREFFKTEPERVIAILRLLSLEDITVKVNNDVAAQLDQVDVSAGEEFKKARRPPLNFHTMGIEIGESLRFLDEDKAVEVEVISDRSVRYQDQEYSLTKLTQELLGLDYAIQPTRRWSYKGRNLNEIYNETYQSS